MQLNDINIQSMSYEQAFAELEEIVYGLETNQKSLEEAMLLFERGQSLSARCAALLDQAELRVRQISGDSRLDDDAADDDTPAGDHFLDLDEDQSLL